MQFIELKSSQHSLDTNSTDSDGSSAICAKDEMPYSTCFKLIFFHIQYDDINDKVHEYRSRSLEYLLSFFIYTAFLVMF